MKQTITCMRMVLAVFFLFGLTAATNLLRGTVRIAYNSDAFYDSTSVFYSREMHRLTLAATNQITVPRWAAGIYILRLADGTTVRLVKQ